MTIYGDVVSIAATTAGVAGTITVTQGARLLRLKRSGNRNGRSSYHKHRSQVDRTANPDKVRAEHASSANNQRRSSRLGKRA